MHGIYTVPHRYIGWLDLTKTRRLFEALLKAGADVNEQNEKGATPLHRAANNNKNPLIIETLLKTGADGKIKNNGGNTAFDLAKKNKSFMDSKAYMLLHDTQYN